MAPANKAGLSEYELQRIKNLEENRKILKSIRKEVRNVLVYKPLPGILINF